MRSIECIVLCLFVSLFNSSVSILRIPKYDGNPYHIDELPPNVPKIVHLVHVPKSGGSSFGIILKRLLSVYFVYNISLPSELQGCTTASHVDGNGHVISCGKTLKEVYDTPRCHLLIGCVYDHRPYLHYLDKPTMERISVTMLRHPVSRLASAYYHGFPHTGIRTRGCGKPPKCISFEEFVSRETFRNMAVRMFGLNQHPLDLARIPDKSTNTIPPVTDENLSVAMSNLKKFQFVGLHEAYYTSFKLMFAVLKWGQPQYNLLNPLNSNDCRFGQEYLCSIMATKNVKVAYHSFITHLKQNVSFSSYIKQHHDMDIQLYNFAKKIFCAQLHQFYDVVLLGDEKALKEIANYRLCPDLRMP